MELNSLPKVTKTKKKRPGRGYGSGKGGHTVGKGTKGQKSRGSRKVSLGFEGGQSPLYKKMPKIGHFKGVKKGRVSAISLVSLNTFREGSKVTPEKIVEKGIIDVLPKDGVKILANGDLHKKLEIEGFLISKGAREKIEKSGSKIIDIKQ